MRVCVVPLNTVAFFRLTSCRIPSTRAREAACPSMSIEVGFGIGKKMSKSKDRIGQSWGTSAAAEIKRLREKIAKLNKELEDKDWASRKTNEGIKILYKELEKKNEELKKISQLKSDFVSIVSHELRTPLSIIKESILLVLDEVVGKINEEQKDFLRMGRDNIECLVRIINDLLDISRIEAGRIELKKAPVDFPGMVQDICSRWTLESNKKYQSLQVSVPESPINIYADPDKITQVLNNLVSNAIKFTPEKGKIEVELKDKKGRIEISVSDTGIGIARKNLPKTFGKFQQFARDTGSDRKGTGLGLAIAKEFIEMHRGIIKVESKLNKGSKFTFSFPKMDAEQVLKEYIGNEIRGTVKKKASLSLVVIHILEFDRLLGELGYDKVHNLLKNIEKMISGSLQCKTNIIVVKETGELMVFLSDTKKEDARIMKIRVEKIVNAYLYKSREKQLKKIRITYNHATYPEEAANVEELLNKARAIS